jgi:hypothetical protein
MTEKLANFFVWGTPSANSGANFSALTDKWKSSAVLAACHAAKKGKNYA